MEHDFRPSSPSSQFASSPGSFSNTQLATLLADAYRENDNLRKELAALLKRAEKAERIIQVINSDSIITPTSTTTPTPTPTTTTTTTNGGVPPAATAPLDVQQLQQKHTERVAKLIDDYEDQLRSAHLARDEAETRRRVLVESWEYAEKYIADLELRSKDVRSAISRIASGTSTISAFSLPGLPSPITLVSATTSSPSSANPTQYPTMGPPGAVPSHRSSKQSSSRTSIFPVLSPHSNPNQPGASHPVGTRRPRTPSADPLNASQPPTKRSRGNAEDQRGRDSRTSYSEPLSQYIGMHDYPDQLRHRRQTPLQGHPEARIIDRNYGSYQEQANTGFPHRNRHPNTHSRSGSHSSVSSLDVDEMLLQATAGGEEPGALPNTNGARYYDTSQQQQGAPGRRKDGESPRPPSATNISSTNHYQQSSSVYPTNSPVSASLRGVQASQGHVYTTHVFAPVVTGAPTKKSKFPNTALNTGPGVPGSSSSDNAQGGAPVTAPFAATNAQGQRICRQCGMVGRYKDGKCVEKWGPGPMGPGTVCDRCRKKMKRVERRGTLESQQMQNAAMQQFQPRPTSHAQPPGGSQGSDRSIQRSDTLLINQSLGPSSFAQPRLAEGSSHQRGNSGSTSPGKNSRHAPTPPAIASLRDQDDENEAEAEEQGTPSVVGRGKTSSSSVAQSRPNSRNGRGSNNNNSNGAAAATTTAKKSSSGLATTTSSRRPSSSPVAAQGDTAAAASAVVDGDEMDADADAEAELDAETEMGAADVDADADADAELLEAVDAAEASGGERSWMKSETT